MPNTGETLVSCVTAVGAQGFSSQISQHLLEAAWQWCGEKAANICLDSFIRVNPMEEGEEGDG